MCIRDRIGYDPFVSKEKAEQLNIELMPFEEVIKNADIITVHVPKTKETINLINKKEIEKMKDGVIIINCARGGIINEKDLADAIKSGKVKRAALDVYEKEPPFDSPVLELDNVVMIPHLGASTVEAQEKVGIGIVEQVIDALKGKEIRNAINIPAVDPAVFKEIQPYIILNEKLGSFVSQIIEGSVKNIVVEYSGDVTKYNLEILTIAALKGVLQPVTESNVNYVNAKIFAQERGIEVVEKTTTIKSDFPNLISITIQTDKEKRRVFGTLSVNKESRIVKIDNFETEIVPEKYMILYKNVDKPGVIGRMGTILGENKINIASFALGRSKEEKIALGILTVDSEVPEDVVNSINTIRSMDIAIVVLRFF